MGLLEESIVKEILYSLSNLLNEMNASPSHQPIIDKIISDLQRSVNNAPGPRVKRLAYILSLLAVDAIP